MSKYKSEIIRILALILFLVMYYYISNFVIQTFSNKINYIPYYIWTYIWTLLLMIIFSIDYIVNIFRSERIKINYLYLILSLCMLTMHIPKMPLFKFLLHGQMHVLLLVFWYSIIHIFNIQKTDYSGNTDK